MSGIELSARRGGRRARLAAVLLATGIAIAAGALPAHATFAGGNGAIAFSSAPNLTDAPSLQSINPNGTGRRTIAPPSALGGRFSPSGRLVVFSSQPNDDAGSSLFVKNANGTGSARPVTSVPSETLDIAPTWSPDGRRIAFVRAVSSGSVSLMVVGADGRGARSLGTIASIPLGPGLLDGAPSWSPNGRTIAVGAGSALPNDIWLYPANGTARRRLTRTGDAVTPNWSPDGRRLLFVRTTGGRRAIWTMNADGSRQRRLTRSTSPATDAWVPVWSPDAQRIAYTRGPLFTIVNGEPTTGRGGIWTMNANGSRQRALVDPPLGIAAFPDWQAVGYPGFAETTAARTSATVMRGRAPLALRCRARGTTVCAGTLVLHARLPGARRAVRIGGASFSVRAGRRATARASLSSAARRAIDGGATLSGRLTLTTRQPSPARARVKRATVTLRAPM